MGRAQVRRVEETRRDEAVEVQRVAAPGSPATVRRVPVGRVDDPLEAQADRLAERALAISADHQSAAGGSASAGASTAPSAVRRSGGAGAVAEGLEVGEDTLRRAAAGGSPLEVGVRERMEQGFGADLSGVRVHTGGEAAGVARNIQARAFTHGNDVYFGAGEYRPGTAEGDQVLAHELAHTVQAGGGEAGVHRFPATWLTSPVPWKGLTGSVFRPGEGASGGVYILTSKDPNGAVKKVVAKPVFGKNGLGLRESGEQLQFSDVALARLLGLRSPQSKVVPNGSTEFGHLVDVCRTKQPAPNPGETAVSLADAESFVVMSEVPNATSIASLADKAATDKSASADLFRSVFDDTFLAELGRLCIGDLLLGNPDRMVLGAMNLGNVMMSMQNGRGQLAAIDTTAYLPRVVPPSDVAKQMGDGGWHTMKSTIDKGPGPILDGFFEVLVSRLKAATPADAGPMPAWQVIETTYQNGKDRFLASFDYGWNDAMITALSLSQDEGAIDRMAAPYDDEDISSQKLKANLDYLGNRAQGKSHDESVGRSIALMAGEWVNTIDRSRMVPPSGDTLAARSLPVPAGAVRSAEVVSMPKLPTGANLKHLGHAYPTPLPEKEVATLPLFASRVAAAKSQIEEQVTATKSRRKGLFGPKEDVPRNRSVISHYVADVTGVSAGAARAADASTYLAKFATEGKALLGGDFRANEAIPVKALMAHMGATVPVLAAELASYKRQLASAKAVMPQTKHTDKAELTSSMDLIEQYVDRATAKLADTKKLDLQRVAAGIKARPT